MAQVWPGTLPSYVLKDGFKKTFRDNVIRTQVEGGPDKVRRRFTQRRPDYEVTMWLQLGQVTTLENFYFTTLSGGIDTFNFNNPITQAVGEFRMMGPPEFKPVGVAVIEVSMKWEEIL